MMMEFEDTKRKIGTCLIEKIEVDCTYLRSYICGAGKPEVSKMSTWCSS